MRALIQRVSHASVSVDQKLISQISKGLLVFLGVGPDDDPAIAKKLALKVSKLRIFNDQDMKMNLSLQDIQGEVLVVSQFTLYADAAKGNRPSYKNAASPSWANALYETFCQELENQNLPVQKGVFAADMNVELLNQGPVTIFLDTEHL